MRSSMRVGFVSALVAVNLLALASALFALPYSQRKVIIEVNGTAGDGGIQIFVDAEGWNRLEVFDPTGEKVVHVGGSGSVGTTGITELFFESAEPSFQDLPLDQLLVRFPEGNYSFVGTTVDGARLSGKAPLKHNIPAGPLVTSPEEGATLDPGSPIVIDWDPVVSPFPGTTLPVTIGGYQVIVERVKPQPLLAFSVFLPATMTQVTVPAEFVESGANYKFEVLAIEESGNQTITESSFTTKVPGLGASSGNRGPSPAATLRVNHPGLHAPAAVLEFGLPSGGTASLRVMDVRGRLVRTIVAGTLPAGQHRAAWDGTDEHGRRVASGVYLAVLTGSGVSQSRKIVWAR